MKTFADTFIWKGLLFESINWKSVYGYVASREKELPKQRRYCTFQRLSARVVFADDGSQVPGFPPENAFTYTGAPTQVSIMMSI